MTVEREQKARCDSYIDGDVVNDPKWGPVPMVELKLGSTLCHVVKLNEAGQWSPRRYTGKLPSATGKFDYEIETGTWVVKGAFVETGRGEYPSQAVEDAIKRTREKAIMLKRMADVIERDARNRYESGNAGD